MNKIKIVKKTYPMGSVSYQIQKRRWHGYYTAIENCNGYVEFNILEEALKHVPLYDGTRTQSETAWEN